MYDSVRFSGAFGGKWNDVNNATSEFGFPLHGVVEISSVPEPTSFAIIGGCLSLLGWATLRSKN
jgi:hypothetical protein